ncbi:MAG: NAD-dependent epimerase/dehydratase family protein [Treponema sp.]|jgi:nucleoside-diphosphate-sugar epimerase|nr:NAD-dependent epimerase/dehydratase family protein [Treponema sp.]
MFSNNKLYNEDIAAIASCAIEWERLMNTNILITGATGLIGTAFVDALMYRNAVYKDNITVYAMSRNIEKARERFGDYFNNPRFIFIQRDVQSIQKEKKEKKIDFIIHGASNTHPLAYSTDPINTILLSVLGTKNILDLAVSQKVKRAVFLSTVEIYGENRGDVERFDEAYCGYINCNTLRAGYPEGKRAAEALCQAYISEKESDIVIARCSRVYGPTMSTDDSKAVAQFLRNAAKNENIILKSEGTQRYSFCYVADVCVAVLFLLLNGKNGEAYNIADSGERASLYEIAEILSNYVNKQIVYDIPALAEAKGYSKATKAVLDCSKIGELGWKSAFSIKEGLVRTLEIMKSRGENDRRY